MLDGMKRFAVHSPHCQLIDMLAAALMLISCPCQVLPLLLDVRPPVIPATCFS